MYPTCPFDFYSMSHNSVLTFEFISWLRVIAVISGRDTAVTVWHSPRNERWLPWGPFVL